MNRCSKLRARQIPLIAYFPLAPGALATPDSIIARVVSRLGMTPAQAAIAWLLKHSPSLVAIPGTCSPEHLRENVVAASLQLSDEDLCRDRAHRAQGGDDARNVAARRLLVLVA